MKTEERKTLEYKGMHIPMLSNGLILTMPQGGPIQYKSEFEAQRHADLFEKGWNGGASASNVDDVI